MCKRPKLVTHYSNEWNCITVFALRQEVLKKNLSVAGADLRRAMSIAALREIVSAYAFTNTAGDCLARMVLVTANHNPHAFRLSSLRLSPPHPYGAVKHTVLLPRLA